MIKKINISIFIFLIHISVYSNKLISGTVLDCKTNLPLPGAEIIFDKNSSNSELVLSNFDGYFELEISEEGIDPDKREYFVSNKKIESFGWLPKVSLDDGIKELSQVYKLIEIKDFDKNL